MGLCELTPKQHNKDPGVKIYNSHIDEYAYQLDYITVVKHRNLRRPEFMYDNKHTKQQCFARFASNLRRGLKWHMESLKNFNRPRKNLESFESNSWYDNRFTDNKKRNKPNLIIC